MNSPLLSPYTVKSRGFFFAKGGGSALSLPSFLPQGSSVEEEVEEGPH